MLWGVSESESSQPQQNRAKFEDTLTSLLPLSIVFFAQSLLFFAQPGVSSRNSFVEHKARQSNQSSHSSINTESINHGIARIEPFAAFNYE